MAKLQSFFARFFLFVFFLNACTTAPLQPSHQLDIKTLKQGGSQASNLSRILPHTQTLTEPSLEELEELAPLLADFETANPETTETDFAISHVKHPRLHVIQFKAGARNTKKQVKIPSTGTFKLVLEAGNKAKIVDGDASDGEARLKLPKGTFDTLFHLQRNWQKNSKLKIKDPLYALEDTLHSKKGRLFQLSRWSRLGLRALPIPDSWHSPDGNALVLHFDAKRVKEFQMIWYQRNEPAPLPPSIQVVPRLDCVEQNLNGSYTAYLGYDNLMSDPVDLPIGVANHVSPEPANRGQMVHFEAGSSPAYPESFPLVFTEEQISWTLNGHQISIDATDESLACAQSQAEIVVPQDVTVRKHFLPLETYRIDSGNVAHFDLPFTVDEASDLKRRVIVNLHNGDRQGGGTHVSGAEVRINGQKLFPHISDQNLLNSETPGASFQSFGAIHTGENILELDLKGEPGAIIELGLEGLMMPVDIPGTLHSRSERLPFERGAKIYPGRLRLKFAEGLKVRLDESKPIYQQFSEEEGLNLFLMEIFLRLFEVEEIHRYGTGAIAEEDAYEQEDEAFYGFGVPNRNIDFDLFFPEDKDVWKMVEILRFFPFVEEATPEFIPELPQASASYPPIPSMHIPSGLSVFKGCKYTSSSFVPRVLYSSLCPTTPGGVERNYWLKDRASPD